MLIYQAMGAFLCRPYRQKILMMLEVYPQNMAKYTKREYLLKTPN
jgi:hypothetical protein